MRVIAVDGPAASGKSSTARAAARRLGWVHLESGALYRAVTLAGLDNLADETRGTTSPEREVGVRWSGQRLVALAEQLPVQLILMKDVFRPVIAGVSVAEAIREDRVTRCVSDVAALPEVRHWVNARQRQAVESHGKGVVVDGRDIGTVVFPDAPLKVFLTASPEERARRRLVQRGAGVEQEDVTREAEVLASRDRADSMRLVAPLARASDAVILDTSTLSLDEQVAHVVTLARARFPG